MTRVTGKITGVFENEKSDAVMVGKTKVILKKGTGGGLLQHKGANVTINAKESEHQGKVYLHADSKDIHLEEGGTTGTVGTTTGGKFTQSSQAMTDGRQESIVFQNAMAHATAITLHNSGGKQVELKDVLRLAYSIARIAVKPDLFRPNPNTDKQETEVL